MTRDGTPIFLDVGTDAPRSTRFNDRTASRQARTWGLSFKKHGLSRQAITVGPHRSLNDRQLFRHSTCPQFCGLHAIERAQVDDSAVEGGGGVAFDVLTVRMHIDRLVGFLSNVCRVRKIIAMDSRLTKLTQSIQLVFEV